MFIPAHNPASLQVKIYQESYPDNCIFYSLQDAPSSELINNIFNLAYPFYLYTVNQSHTSWDLDSSVTKTETQLYINNGVYKLKITGVNANVGGWEPVIAEFNTTAIIMREVEKFNAELTGDYQLDS